MQCPSDGTCSNQGICDISTGICICDSGFQGDMCQEMQCFVPGDCSNQGICDVSTGNCNCNLGFQGDMCQDVQCPGNGNCSNQGICDVSTGNCNCNPGFQGDICQDVQCPGDGNCSNQGICDISTGTCTCDPGFQGDMCQDIQCPDDGTCSNQGICDVSTGTCTCNSGFQGDMCQFDGTKQCGTCENTYDDPRSCYYWANGGSCYSSINSEFMLASCKKACNVCGDVSSCPCPIDNKYYQLIGGKCFHFETASLTHDEAQANCMEKFENYDGGKLFEPKNNHENYKVSDIAWDVMGFSFAHIGVTDNMKEGSWAFDSDGSTVGYNPGWHHAYGGTDLNCILFCNKGDWADFSCTKRTKSICESVLNKSTTDTTTGSTTDSTTGSTTGTSTDSTTDTLTSERYRLDHQ